MTVNHLFIFPVIVLYIPSAIRYVRITFTVFQPEVVSISFDQGSLISFSFALFELIAVYFIYSCINNLSLL